MSEIKFRAWCSDVMYPDVYFQRVWLPLPSNKNNFKQIWFYGCDNNNRMLNNPIIMQYIGIKDKNGVEAYAGDIYQSPNSVPFEIRQVGGGFVIPTFILKNCKFKPDGIYTTPLADMQTISWFMANCIKLGNIHENPELLEKP